MILIVGGLELCEHEIAGAQRRCQEEDLHAGVVHGDEAGEQVQVAGEKDQRKQDLRATCIKTTNKTSLQ